jgi:hypothetical protein
VNEKLAIIRTLSEKSNSNLKEQSPAGKLNHAFMERFKSKEAVDHFRSDSKDLTQKIMQICGGRMISLK